MVVSALFIQTASVVAPFVPAGKLRYANNSNYKNDVMIRKEVSLSSLSFSVKVGESVQ